MDVRAQMLVFSSIFSALTEVLGRDIRANDPRMSAGYPPLKLPLWADFAFLMFCHVVGAHASVVKKGVNVHPVSISKAGIGCQATWGAYSFTFQE